MVLKSVFAGILMLCREFLYLHPACRMCQGASDLFQTSLCTSCTNSRTSWGSEFCTRCKKDEPLTNCISRVDSPWNEAWSEYAWRSGGSPGGASESRTRLIIVKSSSPIVNFLSHFANNQWIDAILCDQRLHFNSSGFQPPLCNYPAVHPGGFK